MQKHRGSYTVEITKKVYAALCKHILHKKTHKQKQFLAKTVFMVAWISKKKRNLGFFLPF